VRDFRDEARPDVEGKQVDGRQPDAEGERLVAMALPFPLDRRHDSRRAERW
jgi:hypothetical protein